MLISEMITQDFFFFELFNFIDKTHLTVAKFKTKRKYITILQIGSKLRKDEKKNKNNTAVVIIHTVN